MQALHINAWMGGGLLCFKVQQTTLQLAHRMVDPKPLLRYKLMLHLSVKLLFYMEKIPKYIPLFFRACTCAYFSGTNKDTSFSKSQSLCMWFLENDFRNLLSESQYEIFEIYMYVHHLWVTDRISEIEMY